METIKIFTDGACSNNQSAENIGGWGAVLEFKGNLKEICGGELNTTNNRMEIKALIEALKTLKRSDIPIEIYSDSSYLVNCFRDKWYVKWQLNGWLNSQKQPVENQDLWEELIELVKQLPHVTFFRAKGHMDLSKTAEINKWYKKISEINGNNPSHDDFLHICRMNNKADALANDGLKCAK